MTTGAASVALPATNVFDHQALARLRLRARAAPGGGAASPVAGEFEAVLLQTLLKSLRAGVPASGLSPAGSASPLFTELLDQQRALTIARGRGLGLAPRLTAPVPAAGAPAAPTPRPLGAGTPAPLALADRGPAGFSLAGVRRWAGPVPRVALDAAAGLPLAGAAAPLALAARPAAPDPAPDRAQFVADLWPHAEAASAATGIPAHFLVAQAALETGWGEKVLKNAQGMSSYNVFNLKAGSRWDGPTLSLPVREYAEGAPVTEHATFRMYGSYADAFADYARLLTQAPRYAAVLGQREAADFARTLHQAGFATDPGYAAKLERIITGPTLRQGAPATS